MKKRILIWFVGGLITIGISMLICMGVFKSMISEVAPTTGKYALIGELIVDPENIDLPQYYEEYFGYLITRAALSDYNRVSDFESGTDADSSGIKIFKDMVAYVGAKITTSTAYAFVSAENKEPRYGKGIWGYAHRENYEGLTISGDNARGGIFNLEKLWEGEYGDKLKPYFIASLNQTVRLEKYAIKGIEIIPLTISIVDINGEVTESFVVGDESELSEDWIVAENENMVVYTIIMDYSVRDYETDEKLLTGVRKLRDEVIEDIDFENPVINDPKGEGYYLEISSTPLSASVKMYSVADGDYTGIGRYAMVETISIDYSQAALIFTALLLLIYTICYILVSVIVMIIKG